jgi:hypothetical protein
MFSRPGWGERGTPGAGGFIASPPKAEVITQQLLATSVR